MAAGQTMFASSALGAMGPTTNAATLDTRNTRPVLDFDDTTAETIHFMGALPSNYSGGDLEVTLNWAATTATSGNVRWTAQFERIEAGGVDLDASDFQTAASVTSAANGTSGVLSAAAITLTALNTAVAGDTFRLLVQRVAADAADTMTGDAELLSVTIKEA